MFDNVQSSKSICSKDGCGKETHAKTLCHNHYRESKRRAAGAKAQEKRPDICIAYKCTRKHYSLNYCAAHYARYKAGGTVNESKPIKVLVYNQTGCLVPSCEKPHHSSGLCKTHDTTKRTYSLSVEKVIDMLSKACEVCGNSGGLTIDHDHLCCNSRSSCGKCVRGTLCQHCNRSMGQAKDNSDILRKLADYLDSYSLKNNNI